MNRARLTQRRTHQTVGELFCEGALCDRCDARPTVAALVAGRVMLTCALHASSRHAKDQGVGALLEPSAENLLAERRRPRAR